MNRRKFLSSLVVLPVIGSAVKALGITFPLPTENNLDKRFVPEQDQLSIFTPEEISRHWIYVNKPAFLEYGKAYCVMFYKLNFLVKEDPYADEFDYCRYQDRAIEEVAKLKLTHIYSVRLHGPFYDPITFEKLYGVIARGAKVEKSRGFCGYHCSQ